MSLDPLRRWERHIGALPLPSPLVWALLVGAFLGFGVLLGHAAGSHAVDSLASERAPLKLLVAQGSASPAAGGSDAGGSSAAATPPSSEPESTPEPSSTSAEPSSTPAESPGSSAPAAGSKASSPPSSSSGSSNGSKESSGAGTGASKAPSFKLSSIKHVFVVMLDEQPYATAFGPSSSAKYLTGTLEKQGELLLRYYAVAHQGLADGIALLSGQGPTEATAANCPAYSAIVPAAGGGAGQVLGKGCVYPSSTPTLMSQLAAKRLTWKAYVEGIDEGPATPGACAHPPLGAPDPSAAALASGTGARGTGASGTGSAGTGSAGTGASGTTAPGYQTWRNPPVYFSSITASAACASRDVGFGALKADLASVNSTAGFSYIVPGPCDDGNPTPCAPGKAAGMLAADGFLQKVVPEILASKAYKQNGLLAITVNQAPSSGEYADSSSCCGQPKYPNLPAPTGLAAISGAGGGQVGLLLLSPFIKKGGGLTQETYNHFSLLATIEEVFGLGRLGYAGASAVKPFSASLF